MRDGHCKLGFPQPLHDEMSPALRECERRYKYNCPRECDRYTVPWLPDLALLFDAHVNLVKIIRAEWSSYLLKYTTKPNPVGQLSLHEHELLQLGFENVDQYQRAVASRFATSTVYQPAQLALVAMDVPTFRLSRVIAFVDTRPPERRTLSTRTTNNNIRPKPDAQYGYEHRPRWLVRGQDLTHSPCHPFHRSVRIYTFNALVSAVPGGRSHVSKDRWEYAIAQFDAPAAAAVCFSLLTLTNVEPAK